MPVETSRTVSSLKIKDPDDPNTFVVLKIIDQIGFVKERGFQEYVYGFQNWRNEGTRTSRTVEVGESKLKVQRIDTLKTIDENKLYQESVFTFNNSNPPTHLKTHDVKIYATDAQGNKNEDVWIKVRRVDQIGVMDPKEGYQETVFSLNWSTNPDWDYTNRGRLYEQTPPYRLDPFQTIIDTSFDTRCMLVFYGTNQIVAVSMANLQEPTVLLRKTLEESDWSWDIANQPYKHQTQLRFGKHTNVVGSTLKIASGVITRVAAYEDATYYNTDYSILNGVQAPAQPFTPFQADTRFNGAASTIYTNSLAQFAVGDDRALSIVSPPKADLWALVDSQGQGFSYSIGPADGNSEVWSPEQRQQVSDLINSDPTQRVYPTRAMLFAGPGKSDVQMEPVIWPAYDEEFEVFNFSTTQNEALLPVFSQSGGLDSVEIVSIPKTYTRQYIVEPFYDEESYSVGVYSYTLTIQDSGVSYEGMAPPNYQFVGQNLCFDAKDGDWYMQMPADTNNNWMSVTPYGTFEKQMYPWLHASNGKHVIQGIGLTPTPSAPDKIDEVYFWLDRVSYDEQLAALVGDIDTIEGIWLDVKMSDIQKLK